MTANKKMELQMIDDDKVPESCIGCGKCCKAFPVTMINKSHEKYFLEQRDVYLVRGMDLKLINGDWWIMSPKCKHLKAGKCMIQKKKPEVCKDAPQGGLTCRSMLKIYEDER